MTLPELMLTLSKFSTNSLLNRDSFQKRISNNNSIGAHELLVPILQGLDSVELKSDIEVGGSDQLFNFLLSRSIQEISVQKTEICIMSSIINGLDGRKMSKSFGNCIFINDSPENVFGKVMSISDAIMDEWKLIFLDKQGLKHPLEQKKELAFEITALIWGLELATIAKDKFEEIIQNKGIPEKIPVIESIDLIDSITKIVQCSKSEVRRLLSSNSVSINGFKTNEIVPIKNGDIIKIGKRNYGRLELKD